MGCVSLPDALVATFVSTPSGVSGEHYDKIEQQQRRAVTSAECDYLIDRLVV
jgi:hypothetical protein